MNERRPCIKNDVYTLKTHPSDVVFHYDEPYAVKRTYISCDPEKLRCQPYQHREVVFYKGRELTQESSCTCSIERGRIRCLTLMYA